MPAAAQHHRADAAPRAHAIVEAASLLVSRAFAANAELNLVVLNVGATNFRQPGSAPSRLAQPLALPLPLALALVVQLPLVLVLPLGPSRRFVASFLRRHSAGAHNPPAQLLTPVSASLPSPVDSVAGSGELGASNGGAEQEAANGGAGRSAAPAGALLLGPSHSQAVSTGFPLEPHMSPGEGRGKGRSAGGWGGGAAECTGASTGAPEYTGAGTGAPRGYRGRHRCNIAIQGQAQVLQSKQGQSQVQDGVQGQGQAGPLVIFKGGAHAAPPTVSLLQSLGKRREREQREQRERRRRPFAEAPRDPPAREGPAAHRGVRARYSVRRRRVPRCLCFKF